MDEPNTGQSIADALVSSLGGWKMNDAGNIMLLTANRALTRQEIVLLYEHGRAVLGLQA